jgi:hypothetical protein
MAEDKTYMSVPAAGLALRCDSATIYRMCQRGQLDALCENGRWFVTRESVARADREGVARRVPA